jgi:hypothetical protein
MRVKMSMLYDGLKSCILCKKGSSYNKSVPVDDVCFSKKSKIPSDVRYLFIDWSDYDQSAYVNIPSEMLILASRSESIENEHFPPCALIVYAASSLSLLFEMCRDVMRTYFEWGDSLLSLMMNSADLNQLTSHAHNLLANPIMILDNSMKLLAYTPDDPMDDAVWGLTVDKGYADLDHQASLMTQLIIIPCMQTALPLQLASLSIIIVSPLSASCKKTTPSVKVILTVSAILASCYPYILKPLTFITT